MFVVGLQDKLQRRLAELQLLDELEKKVKDILKEIQAEKGYAYILNYGPGTGVLMVDDKLDITALALERLNAVQAAEAK